MAQQRDDRFDAYSSSESCKKTQSSRRLACEHSSSDGVEIEKRHIYDFDSGVEEMAASAGEESGAESACSQATSVVPTAEDKKNYEE